MFELADSLPPSPVPVARSAPGPIGGGPVALQDRAGAAVVALGINAALGIVALLFSFSTLNSLETFSGTGAVSNEALPGAIGIMQLVASIACVVLFCRWMYRAYSNLHHIAPAPLQYDPGRAVGSFFLPLVNFVRPYMP